MSSPVLMDSPESLKKKQRIQRYHQQEAARIWNQTHLNSVLEPHQGSFKVILSLDSAPNCVVELAPQTTLKTLKEKLETVPLLGQYAVTPGNVGWRLGKAVNFGDYSAVTVGDLDQKDELGVPVFTVITEQQHQEEPVG